MKFERITSPSLKELFVRQMERMILSGELEVGSQIPGERELAEQMGVSRTVVNSGINEMAAKGFLEIRPRKGVYVADYRRSGSLATLISIMEYNGGLLPQREVRSLIEVRLAMEELSLRKAIPVLDEKGKACLRERLDELVQAQTPQDVAECRYAFGHELDCQSGNAILPLLAHSFKRPCTALWAEYSRRYGIEHLKRHCQKTMECIEENDVEGAVAYLHKNMNAALSGERQIYKEQ